MKTFMVMIATVAALATPAMADKMPIKPVKPAQVDTCGSEKTDWIIAYNLEQIEMAIKEIRKYTTTEVKPKPKDNFKKAG